MFYTQLAIITLTHFFPRRQLVALGLLMVIALTLLLSTAGRAQSTCTNPYIVRQGDGLNKIAQACGISVQRIRAANPQVTDPNYIEAGDLLALPNTPATPMLELIEHLVSEATYSLLVVDTGIIDLRKLKYESTDAVPEIQASLLDKMAVGDVNFDGIPDAATILVEQRANMTGRFYSLHLLLGSGSGRQLTYTEAGAVFINDRIRVNHIEIQEDGAILLDLYTKGPNDPLAAATWHVVQTYRLRNDQLLLFDQRSVEGDQMLNNPRAVCPNTYATQLWLGGRAFVRADNPGDKYLRSEVGNESNVTGVLPAGIGMTITAGPRCRDARIWWYVEADNGLAGWTSEGSPERYYLWPVLDGGMINNGVVESEYGNPVVVLLDYYHAIDRGLATNNLREAHNYWSAQRKAQSTYAGFQRAYRNTRKILVHDVTISDRAPRTATLVALVTTTDLRNGQLIDLHYETTYRLVVEDNRWRVHGPTIKELDELPTNPTLAPAPTSPTGAMGDFSGIWQSNFAVVDLTQSNNSVIGTYVKYSTNDRIQLYGSVTGNVLRGTTGDGATFRLTLSADGNTFEGDWLNLGHYYPWCGVRNGPLQKGCGFSGRWNTNHEENGWVELIQVGNWVSGRYFNGATEGIIEGIVSPSNGFFGISGRYAADTDIYDSGTIRFTLPDLEESRFQGCWQNTYGGELGNWCGRPGVVDRCPRVEKCE